MNSSNLLANRTRRLIDQVKPDVLFVQTSSKWWECSKHLEYVKSQEEMDKANEVLSQISGTPKSLKGLTNIRFSLQNFLFKKINGLNLNHNPFIPGLEVKYAIEEASKLNSKLVFMGPELSEETANKIKHDKRFTLIKFLYRYFSMSNDYKFELFSNKTIMLNKGIRQFSESMMDIKSINWFIQTSRILFPELTRILVDQKDEEIFKFINANKGKKMVAIVNQHHMPGIEQHWCNTFGTVPTLGNHLGNEFINPIGDMPIREMLLDKMYHVIKREIGSSRLKSSPASFTNEINVYHREFNHQYEHRNM